MHEDAQSFTVVYVSCDSLESGARLCGLNPLLIQKFLANGTQIFIRQFECSKNNIKIVEKQMWFDCPLVSFSQDPFFLKNNLKKQFS